MLSRQDHIQHTTSNIFRKNKIGFDSFNHHHFNASPTSLSMKLRVDAVFAGDESYIRKFPLLHSNSERDSIQSARNNEFNSKSPFLKKLRRKLESNTKLTTESNKLSGLNDELPLHIMKYKVVPDRSQINHPSTICVRCSSQHSSLCMDCCQTQLEEAIKHDHMSLSEGAFIFFHNGLIRGSHKNLTKFIVFTIWKNFTSTIIRLRRKWFVNSTIMHRKKLQKLPFSAWKDYVNESKLRKVETELKETHVKLSHLEKYLEKIRHEKAQEESKVT